MRFLDFAPNDGRGDDGRGGVAALERASVCDAREDRVLEREARVEYAPPPRRHLASFAASIAAHAALIALILYFAPRIPEQGHDWVLAYVVDMGGGRGGVAGQGKGAGDIRMELHPMPDDSANQDFSTPPTESASLSDLDDSIKPMPRPGVMESLNASELRPYRRRGVNGKGSSSAHGHGFSSGGGLPGGNGEGAGSGGGIGDGTGIEVAHADYGANPAPRYPARSRLRAEQGTVTLHVLVAADGRVKQIEIAQSSGFDDLDEAALETVRSRWRFVPAHRSDGEKIESWVLVPIRFALR